MKLSEQVKPISYLKAHASEIINGLTNNRNPVIITQNGEAKAILQDLQSYEETKESLALLKILAQSQNNKTRGNFKSVSKTFSSIKSKIREG